MTNKKEKGDTARINYEMARWEIIQRIEARDNILILFLGAVATVFGLYFENSNRWEIMLILPVLSLGASVIISHHHTMIGVISNYLTEELEPFFRKIDQYAPQWDSSKSLKSLISKPRRFHISLSSVAYNALINGPTLVGLVIVVLEIYSSWSYWYLALIIGEFIILLLSIFTLINSRNYRTRIYRNQSFSEDNE